MNLIIKVAFVALIASSAYAHNLDLSDVDFNNQYVSDFVPIDGQAKSLLDFSHFHLGAKTEEPLEIEELFIRNRASGVSSEMAENRLKAFVESLVETIPNSVDAGSIGPYKLEGIEFPVFDLDVFLDSIVIVGLDDMRIENFSFSIFTLRASFRVVIPRIRVTARFNGMGSAAKIINLYFNGGKLRFVGDEITVDVQTRLALGLFGGNTSLRELDLDIVIAGNTFLYIEGLVSNGYINFGLNWFIQRISRHIMENEMARVSAYMSDIVLTAVNYLAAEYNIIDILFPRS